MNEEDFGKRLPVRPATSDSLTTIVNDLVGSTQLLARQEVDRVKAEAMERVEVAKGQVQEKGKGVGLLGGAAIFTIIALALLAITIFFLLYELAGLAGWLSGLIVTLLYVVIAAALAYVGRNILVTPDRSATVPREEIQHETQ